MQLWFPLSFRYASPDLTIYLPLLSLSDFLIPKQHTPSRKSLLFSRNLSLLVALTVPGMIIHQFCLMGFFNVIKRNWMNDQNLCITHTHWMFTINLSVSSTNTVRAWLVYHWRYGDQKSHQNTKHLIIPMILMIVFLIM